LARLLLAGAGGGELRRRLLIIHLAFKPAARLAISFGLVKTSIPPELL
jgi:hypothetical protein